MKLPEYLKAWVVREFNPKWHERVYQELLDVMTGTSIGNPFTRDACKRVYGMYTAGVPLQAAPRKGKEKKHV